MKLNLKVKRNQLSAFLLVLIWFPPTSMFNTNALWFLIVQYITSLFIIGKKYHISRNQKESKYYILLAYVMILFIVTYLAHENDNVSKCLLYIVKLLGLFYWFKGCKMPDAIEDFYPAITFFEIINIGSVILKPNGFFQNILGEPIFAFGGKFTVFYMNLLWLLVFLIHSKKRDSKIIKIVLCIAFLVVSSMTRCGTAILCAAGLFILIWFEKIMAKMSPKIMMAFLFLLNFFVVVANRFLALSSISYIITNLLRKNIMLTGRIEIYQNLSRIYSGHWLFGYGYNNRVVYNSFALHYQNVQNALLDIVGTSGVISCALVVLLIYCALTHSENNLTSDTKKYIWIFILLFFVAGTVEIAFNYYFFFIIAACLGCQSIQDKNGLSSELIASYSK